MPNQTTHSFQHLLYQFLFERKVENKIYTYTSLIFSFVVSIEAKNCIIYNESKNRKIQLKALHFTRLLIQSYFKNLFFFFKKSLIDPKRYSTSLMMFGIDDQKIQCFWWINRKIELKALHFTWVLIQSYCKNQFFFFEKSFIDHKRYSTTFMMFWIANQKIQCFWWRCARGLTVKLGTASICYFLCQTWFWAL